VRELIANLHWPSPTLSIRNALPRPRAARYSEVRDDWHSLSVIARLDRAIQ
jgi:hypothetical protein